MKDLVNARFKYRSREFWCRRILCRYGWETPQEDNRAYTESAERGLITEQLELEFLNNCFMRRPAHDASRRSKAQLLTAGLLKLKHPPARPGIYLPYRMDRNSLEYHTRIYGIGRRARLRNLVP